MTRDRRDWLDALAWRSTRGRIRRARTSGAYSPHTGDERFSRATALKLALAGGASLSLGLWKTPPALAQDRGECFTQCLQRHDASLQRRHRLCEIVFQPRAIAKMEPGWKRLRYAIIGSERELIWLGMALQRICYAGAHSRAASDKNDCYERCEETCRKRSLQSSSGRSSATCEVTPPRRAAPPTIPPVPPPPPAADRCLECQSRGGECCPGGPTGFCQCATLGVPCSRYNC